MTKAGWRKYGSIFWVEDDFSAAPNHKSETRERFYNSGIIRLAIAVLKAQGVDMSVRGSHNIPANGPALFVMNHTGYFDFVFAGTLAHVRGRRLVRFMAKKEVFDVPVIGAIMRKMKHIPVDRQAGASSLDAAVTSLQQGNLVGIFPEGTISRSFEVKELKSGAVRIAAAANVPLIPVAIWGSQRLWTKDHPRKLGRNHFPVWVQAGTPFELSSDAESDTIRLRATMQKLLEDLRTDYEKEYGPFPGGEYWRPQALGGSAPSMKEAELKEQQERQARAEKKAKKQGK